MIYRISRMTTLSNLYGIKEYDYLTVKALFIFLVLAERMACT